MAGRVACQGVGGEYKAALQDNGNPKGTSPGGTSEAVKMFTRAASKCPNAKIVFGGYRYDNILRMMVYRCQTNFREAKEEL
jgi:cutinase